MTERAGTGLRSYLSGKAAEEAVLGRYVAAGHRLLNRRYRGAGGELDLVFDENGVVVFVEVKSGRSVEAAVARLGVQQMRRIRAGAADYIGHCPAGQRTAMRIDVAAVDAAGRVQVIANAF